MDQRSRLMTGCGMDHHARRLVDHDEIVILVDDFKWDRLSRCQRCIGFGDLELDDITDRHAIRWVGGLAVDADEVTLDEPRSGRAAEVARMRRDETVEPGRWSVSDQPALGLRRKYPAMSRATPMLTAESATLKTGQKWKLMKSVTPPPLMIRSKALPSAPPTIRPNTASPLRSPGWRRT